MHPAFSAVSLAAQTCHPCALAAALPQPAAAQPQRSLPGQPGPVQ